MPDMAQLFSVDNVRLALIELAVLILSISLHEFGHAYVADRLGDPLPRSQGRVTLNPLAHIDPLGTIAFPLVSFFLGMAGSSMAGRILGWGKPVYTSPRARWLKRGMSEQTANLLISVAGPGMNVLLA